MALPGVKSTGTWTHSSAARMLAVEGLVPKVVISPATARKSGCSWFIVSTAQSSALWAAVPGVSGQVQVGEQDEADG